MRTERPIHLDVGVPSGNTFDAQPDTAGHADARSQQQLADQGQSLRDLLDKQRNAPMTEKTETPAKTSPFDLFHPPTAASQSLPVSTPAPASPALDQALEQMARRLLVGDGNNSRRGVQIQLAEGQLPGVVVDVFEEEGRLVASFTCSQEASRERLCAGAVWFADTLAQRLQRDTRVQVQTDDPEDRCLVQVDADH